jgi:UDP-glucose 4-epimerase
MKILVTGGAGFVGSHLVDSLLLAGHEVTVLDDLSTSKPKNLVSAIESPHFKFVQGSILDQTLVEQLVGEVEGCFHLAAALGVERIIERPLESLEINVRGSEIVLRACAVAGIRTLVTSTSEIYGKSQDIPLREDGDRVVGSPLKSRWTYSEAKALEESYAMIFHQQQNLPVVIGRLFNTVGPRQTGAYGMVIPRFVKAALVGDNLRVHGDGSQSRVFCHVSDAVKALHALFNSNISGDVFNIGGIGEITMLALANQVIAQTKSTSQIQTIPYSDAYGPGFEDMQRRVPDISKIAAAIGWAPRVTLEGIIEDVASFIRTHGDN